MDTQDTTGLVAVPAVTEILVAPEGVAGERDLADRVARGVELARSLPAKG